MGDTTSKVHKMKRPKKYTPTRVKAKKFAMYDSGPMYDRAWKRYRIRFLHHNPFCYICGKEATVVDHITPHRRDKTLFEQLDNHLPLCKYHHDFITAKFDRDFSRPMEEVLRDKLYWIAKNRTAKNPVKVLPSYT